MTTWDEKIEMQKVQINLMERAIQISNDGIILSQKEFDEIKKLRFEIDDEIQRSNLNREEFSTSLDKLDNRIFELSKQMQDFKSNKNLLKSKLDKQKAVFDELLSAGAISLGINCARENSELNCGK